VIFAIDHARPTTRTIDPVGRFSVTNRCSRESVREHTGALLALPRVMCQPICRWRCFRVGHRVELAAFVVCRIGDETVERSMLSQA